MQIEIIEFGEIVRKIWQKVPKFDQKGLFLAIFRAKLVCRLGNSGKNDLHYLYWE